MLYKSCAYNPLKQPSIYKDRNSKKIENTWYW